jgi:hypothetical protein
MWMKMLACSAFLVALLSVDAKASEQDAATLLADQVATQRELARSTASVKNAMELRTYLNEHQGPSSPFHGLSRGALMRFTRSLTFTSRGLAGFDYADIRRELTASQVHALLRVFGVEDTAARIPGLKVRTSTDALVVRPMAAHSGYPEMFCSTRGTCAPAKSMVCTSNC